MIPFASLRLVRVVSDAAWTNDRVDDVYDLLDGAQASLARYEFGVAPMRGSRLGGSGEFADVVDTVVVDVWGDTAAACVANADALLRLLDEAAQWDRVGNGGPGTVALQLRMEVLGSSVGELAAVVTGAGPGQPPAALEPTFEQDVRRWLIRGLELRVQRRGLLLVPMVESAFTAGELAGEVVSVAVSNHLTISPIDVRLSSTDSPAVAGRLDGYLVIATNAAYLRQYNLAITAGLSGWANVADATARGGAIVRYSTASGGISSSYSLFATLTPAPLSSVRRVHLFLSVRNRSAAVGWTIAVTLRPGGVALPTQRVYLAPTGGANEGRVLYVGSVETRYDWQEANPLITLTADSLSGSPELDLNTLTLVSDDGMTTGIVALTNVQAPPGNSASRISELLIESRALNGPGPWALNLSNPSPFAGYRDVPFPFAGDVFLQHRGATVAILVLATQPFNAAFPWLLGTAAGARIVYRVDVRRWRGHRVPQ